MKKSKKRRPMHPRSMRALMTFFVIAEILVVVAASSGTLELLHFWFDATERVPDTVFLIVISTVIGSVTSVFFKKFFLTPITKLGEAMRRVAEGDFSVRLDTERGFEEMRKINSDFNLMTKELGATEILQMDFISNVSHEFKTPINAIEGYATLLQGDESMSEEQSKYVEKILFNTQRLSSLVGNILLLSKVDNQSIATTPTLYRLDEQIRQAILTLEAEWTKKDVEFDVDLESIDYKGSEMLMMHVWTNLIGNAIKFGPCGETVRLKLWKDDGMIRFTVEDEGPGVSDDDKKHLFDRFYQGDSSHKVEGNGLGLALVKRIVHNAGGTVRCENTDVGCCFTIELPGDN